MEYLKFGIAVASLVATLLFGSGVLSWVVVAIAVFLVPSIALGVWLCSRHPSPPLAGRERSSDQGLHRDKSRSERSIKFEARW